MVALYSNRTLITKVISFHSANSIASYQKETSALNLLSSNKIQIISYYNGNLNAKAARLKLIGSSLT